MQVLWDGGLTVKAIRFTHCGPLTRGIAHKSSGTASYHKGPEVLPSSGTRQGNSACHRQHHCNVLREQARRNKIKVPAVPVNTSLGMVLSGTHLSGSHPHLHYRQPSGRRVESPFLSEPRVGVRHGSFSENLRQVGYSDHRPVRHNVQQEMSEVCISGRTRSGVVGGRFHGSLERQSGVSVSSHSLGPEVISQNSSNQGGGDLDCTLVAQTTVVLSTSTDGSRQAETSPHLAPNHSG